MTMPKDIAFLDATVLTVDPDFSIAEALAIRGNEILAVGSQADVMRSTGPDATVIRAGGKTIVPGFIDPHVHFLPMAALGPLLNVGPFELPSVDDLISRLSEEVKSRSPGDWIVARQFDPSLQAGPPELTSAMLDRVSTQHPILVLNASLHFGYCNSLALELAAIQPDSPDPDGARFGRNADGSPNGVLAGGAAMGPVLILAMGSLQLDIIEAGLAVCARANRVGVTTVMDQGTGAFAGGNDPAIYQAILATGRMTTRLRYSLFDQQKEHWDRSDLAFGSGDPMVRATAWKIVSDGSNQGRTGYQREPYLDSDEAGFPYVELDEMKRTVARRLREGWQVIIHGNGDRAIDNILDAFEAAAEGGAPMDKRPRIEHCSILHDEQIERMRELGISPSFLIGHVYYWGKAFRDEIFGPEKAALLDRTAACTEAGLRWTLHSDDTVTEIDPLRCIHNAVTRRMWREPESILAPEERVSVEAAIRSMTIDAAWQCHSEHELGSLEPGKLADFVILDEDPRAVDPEHLKDIRISETWMDGRRVYENGGESP